LSTKILHRKAVIPVINPTRIPLAINTDTEKSQKTHLIEVWKVP